MTAPLPVKRVADIPTRPENDRWLIEGLWTRCAVGVIGGPPKSWKTWTGLDLALSVASGTPCLARFPVKERGPALVYLAEDSEQEVRARIAALAGGRGLSVDALDLFVITSPVLWLDRDEHRESLALTIRKYGPKILLLDPLVRLHRQDENDVQAVSLLLGHLRELNRTFDLAIALVHHTAKKERAHPGQSLRGSGDIHAWVDSGLYLARRKHGILLTVEHRSARAIEPLSLSLLTTEDGTARLTAADLPPETECDFARDLDAAVIEELRRTGRPLTRNALREQLGIRNERLGRSLAALERKGHLQRTDDGWTLTPPKPTTRPSTPELPFP